MTFVQPLDSEFTENSDLIIIDFTKRPASVSSSGKVSSLSAMTTDRNLELSATLQAVSGSYGPPRGRILLVLPEERQPLDIDDVSGTKCGPWTKSKDGETEWRLIKKTQTTAEYLVENGAIKTIEKHDFSNSKVWQSILNK